MNLEKVTGIVIKETQYKDNDKIITILTDKLGKISCIARGAKRVNSPILASSQYLVYSEFVLYRGNNFYYINSSSVKNSFYKLRTDLDKLEVVFGQTRILQKILDENEDTSQVLKLFLNTLYVIENYEMDIKKVEAIFLIKLFSLLGFSPKISSCSSCNRKLFEKEEEKCIVYDYVSNSFLCSDCTHNVDTRRCISLSKSTVIAIKYILISEIRKIFSFELKDIHDLVLFGQVYTDSMVNGI